ncbi:MAG: PIN domain-containing protein [Candidatus Bathyarchaeota archaeon]|nr:PIN domain-containing protein [Candidatus Bathyarchaeota archaeon]
MAIEDRRILDVNVLAIYLVSDHPGNEHVSSIMEEGLSGVYTPLIMNILPIRTYWIMTEKWGCDKAESAKAVKYFVENYDRPHYYCLQRQTLTRSFELAEKLNHDIYDCVYLAAAIQENASAIITTDTNFQKLCKRVNLEYINPIPKEVLKRFKKWTQKP